MAAFGFTWLIGKKISAEYWLLNSADTIQHRGIYTPAVKMPPTSEENLMIEQNAKFEGLRELLEDDLEDQDLDDA